MRLVDSRRKQSYPFVNDEFQICRGQNRNFLLAKRLPGAWRLNAFEERLEPAGKSATSRPDGLPAACAFLGPNLDP